MGDVLLPGNRHMSVCWWEPTKDKETDERYRAGALLDETASIENRQASWYELNLWNSTLYTNRVLPGFRWGAMEAQQELWPTNLRTENLIQSIGMAMMSKASTSPLKPTPTPHGKSWKIERAVRMMDQFLMGVWRQTKSEDACVTMFNDAYQSGLGAVRVGFDKKKKRLEVSSIFYDCIVIDNRECSNRGEPRTVRIRECLPRATIEARYGVDLDAHEKYTVDREVGDGWDIIVEAYRRPDANGKGGRHTIACAGKLLVDEKWDHEWIPIVFLHWMDRVSGFFTQGGVEQVLPFQLRQNDLNDDIAESQDVACRARLSMHANSYIDDSQWDNKAGRILLHSGEAPQPIVWPSNLSELYSERDRNRSSAYFFMGISEMFAGADLPPQVRLDSSAGVREMQNMEDSRHLRLWVRFEEARLLVGQTIIWVLSLYNEASEYKATYNAGYRGASTANIPFDAVRMLTDDQYTWTLEATPMHLMAPAVRREALRDAASRGLIDQDSAEARRMLGVPNLERIEDLELASRDDILRHIDIILDGRYEPPTELTNCTLGIKVFTANYHRLKGYEDIEEGDPILQAHIKWIATAATIQIAAVSPTQPVPFAPTQGVAGTSSATIPMSWQQGSGVG